MHEKKCNEGERSSDTVDKKRTKPFHNFFKYNYIFRNITFLYYFSLYNLMRLFLFVFPLSIRVM